MGFSDVWREKRHTTFVSSTPTVSVRHVYRNNKFGVGNEPTETVATLASIKGLTVNDYKLWTLWNVFVASKDRKFQPTRHGTPETANHTFKPVCQFPIIRTS